jgi:hypothetical protein
VPAVNLVDWLDNTTRRLPQLSAIVLRLDCEGSEYGLFAELAAKSLAQRLAATGVRLAAVVEWHVSQRRLGVEQVKALLLTNSTIEQSALRCARSQAPWASRDCHGLFLPGLLIKDTPGSAGTPAGYDIGGERVHPAQLTMKLSAVDTPWSKENGNWGTSASTATKSARMNAWLIAKFPHILRANFRMLHGGGADKAA